MEKFSSLCFKSYNSATNDDDRDSVVGREEIVGDQPPRPVHSQPVVFIQPVHGGAALSKTYIRGDESHLTIDDLLVIKSSFDGEFS